jgi:hypothetical protein
VKVRKPLAAVFAGAGLGGHVAGEDVGVEGIGDRGVADLEAAGRRSHHLEQDVVDLEGVHVVRLAADRDRDLHRRRLDLIEDALDEGSQGHLLSAEAGHRHGDLVREVLRDPVLVRLAEGQRTGFEVEMAAGHFDGRHGASFATSRR